MVPERMLDGDLFGIVAPSSRDSPQKAPGTPTSSTQPCTSIPGLGQEAWQALQGWPAMPRFGIGCVRNFSCELPGMSVECCSTPVKSGATAAGEGRQFLQMVIDLAYLGSPWLELQRPLHRPGNNGLRWTGHRNARQKNFVHQPSEAELRRIPAAPDLGGSWRDLGGIQHLHHLFLKAHLLLRSAATRRGRMAMARWQ